MEHTFEIGQGSPTPLGTSKSNEGINFAFYSSAEEDVSLVLFAPGEKTPFAKFALNPEVNQTEKVWHVEVKKLSNLFDYGIEIGGELLHDPYARCMNTSHEWEEIGRASCRERV